MNETRKKRSFEVICPKCGLVIDISHYVDVKPKKIIVCPYCKLVFSNKLEK